MAKQKIDRYIEQWLKGDELAFKAVVDNYFLQMHAFALQMVSSREDAEELVMNAFLKLWQYKHHITYVSRPDEYLFGILRREIVGHARKRVLQTQPIETVDTAELGMVAHPEFTLRELRCKYQAALDKLTPSQRNIFLLSREQEMSQKEIAQQTGLSINTVGNHMNAALKVFRKEIDECPDLLLVFALSCPSACLFMG